MLASLLLVLVSLGTALPLLQAQESSRPACCRRAGGHHCMAVSHSEYDGFKASANACPYRVPGPVSSSVFALPASLQTHSPANSIQSALPLEMSCAISRAFEGSYTRGPPLA